jgi:hypothetical protein
MKAIESNSLHLISGGDAWYLEEQWELFVTSGRSTNSYYMTGDQGIWGSPSYDWQGAVSSFLSNAARGISTAVGDCANGAAVGAMVGAAIGGEIADIPGAALGATGGGGAGCVYGVGIGLIRDL